LRRTISTPFWKQLTIAASALLLALFGVFGVQSVAAQCSPAWTILDSPNPSANSNLLYGVSALSDTDVWAVGLYLNQSANAYQTLAMHWDGTRWIITPTPNPFPGSDHLKKVTAVSANDVWAIGGHGVTYSLHWDGATWKTVPTPNPGVINYLDDIAAVSANDIWAVGSLDEGGASRIHTLIAHWDGTSWTRTPSPNVLMSSGSAYPSRLNALEVISANDIWAVGEYIIGNQFLTLIEHWDGTRWSIVPSPNGLAGDGRLWDVTAVSPNDVWAVGEYDSPAGSNTYGKSLILHWDGFAWSVVPSPQPSPWGASILYAAVALSANDVWAVGSWANANQGMSTFVVHWDGASWSQVSSPDMPGTGTGWNFLEDITATGANSIWSVGRKQATFGSANLSLVERYFNSCSTTNTALSFVTLNPSNVIGGNSSQATVSLSGPAPAGGAVVTLFSSNPSIANVPASVTIPAGATSAPVTVTTSPVSANDSALIQASWDGATQQATINVSPAMLTSLTLSPTSVTGGTSARGTVILNGPAPSSGAFVSLVSNNTTIATIPSSVTIPAGATSASFTITTRSVTAQSVVSISATYNGVTKGAALTVTPSSTSSATLSSLTLNPTSVVGGKTSQATVRLSAAAPSGGRVVTLSSSNTAVATVPASVTIPAGASSTTFTVTTRSVTANTAVNISASSGGLTRTATLTVTRATTATDTVAVQRAEYTASKRELRVEATSTYSSATLKVYVTSTGQLIGTLSNYGGGKYGGQFTWSSNPQSITVKSSLGGSATKAVALR
jgi:hypothetical protein